MAAGCRRLVREVPEGTQCKLEGGVHHALSGLLAHNMKQLLQVHKGINEYLPFSGKWAKAGERTPQNERRSSPSLWTSLLPAELSALWTTAPETQPNLRWWRQTWHIREKTHHDFYTLAAKMEMMATAILCMFWSSWLHSHCITNLAASNLTKSREFSEALQPVMTSPLLYSPC